MDETIAITAPFAGTVVALPRRAGDAVAPGDPVVVLEAMKMEHEVLAEHAGTLSQIAVAVGDAVTEGATLAALSQGQTTATAATSTQTDAAPDADALATVVERHALGLDARRPEAVAKRHDAHRRTARENLADLLDPDSFVEYGPLAFAAQEQRRSTEDLIANTPADGLVAGTGTVDGDPVAALAYDYTVLAGTQGARNHEKKDRLFELAADRRLPVVLFAEGGGGRPGDVDMPTIAGLDVRAFEYFARLSGLVPLVGIASGYTFAGNAALLGCCDVVIATEDASIGMGGPAMIEGGGLGRVHPREVGPLDVQDANGVVDIRAQDDARAVQAAKDYLSHFARTRPFRTAPAAPKDQTALRDLVPINRKRAYDVRAVIETLADDHLELRRGFAKGMVTALAHVDGRPLGLIANDPAHLGGAIDAAGADKAARFMQLCDAFALPLLLLCDTPGFMVGPDAERTATVRHVTRMFVTGANLSVPVGTVVLRKGYGLGAQAMAGGSFRAGRFCVGWPTSEFGAMGLEGAVRLGMRKELEAIEDAGERQAAYERMVAEAYQRGRGVSMAGYFEIDDVIDPADTRRWVAILLDPDAQGWWQRPGKRRPNVDTW